MAATPKILILSASFGEGHQQAASAVRDAVAVQSPEADVRIVDYIRSVHPGLDSVAKYCYLTSVRFAPALYGWFYTGTSQIPSTSLVQRQLNSIGLNGLTQQLNSYQPDVVLCTFPTPAGVTSHLKLLQRTDVPLATLITDHAVHSQWIHAKTDRYFVGSHFVKAGLMRRGVAAESIAVSGIPVRSEFRVPMDKGELRQRYGLSPDLPTVLVMGGAYGVMGDIVDICEELLASSPPLQVIAVAGRNERMRGQLDAMLARQPADVQRRSRVFGFVHEVHEFMAVSDAMLTKAGGLTISEALAQQLPMVLYRPIPGQEVQNARFLVRAGVAELANSRQDAVFHLRSLLVNRKTLHEDMRRRAGQVRKLHAAHEIAREVIGLATRHLAHREPDHGDKASTNYRAAALER